MDTNTEDTTINAWKQRFDGATRMVEAVAAGSIRAGEAQLRAAADAQKSIEAARRRVQAATDAQEMWRIQNEWFTTNLQRSFALWNELHHAATETNTSVARWLYDPGSALLPPANVLPEASKTALGLFDDAYRRWRDTTIQFWGASTDLARQVTDETRADANTHRRHQEHTGRKSKQDA